MPVISINEQENLTFTSIDASDNAVLIPLLWSRAYTTGDLQAVTYTELDVKSKLYLNSNDLRKDMMTGAGESGAVARYVFIEGGQQIDPSYIMAYELLNQGLPVVIKPIIFENETYQHDGGAVKMTTDQYQTILENAITKENALEEFADKNIYNIKYITTGAYPNFGKCLPSSAKSDMAATIMKLAANRGDAIALVELKKNFKDKEELLKELSEMGVQSNDGKFAAAFFPWCTFSVSNINLSSSDNLMTLPGCFAYLMAYANSIKTNANWFAASGVIRGAIPNMKKPVMEVGESLMHILQGDAQFQSQESSNFLPVQINPIMNAGSYGYRIWGNRVFVQEANQSIANLQYMSFLNVRNLLCDIKKQVFTAAMRTTFEPNDDILWLNFKSLANTLLDKMKSGRGIVWYKWVKEPVAEKATIKARLTIKPIEAVESFDISVLLSNDEVEVAEIGDNF